MDNFSKASSSSTLSGTKFKIEQNVPNASLKKGPHAIVRSAELNDEIFIKRRFGEGSKPLFQRDDIAVNCGEGDGVKVSKGSGMQLVSTNTKDTGSHHKRYSSSESSSPERYRRCDTNTTTTNKRHLSPAMATSLRRRSPSNEVSTYRTEKRDQERLSHKSSKTEKQRKVSKSRSKSPIFTSRSRHQHLTNNDERSKSRGRRSTEKIPYYRDEVRERDRLRRLYGSKSERYRSRSKSPSTRSYRSRRRRESPPRKRSLSNERYERGRSRTRSRTPRDRDGHGHHSTRSSEKHSQDTRSNRERERDRERHDENFSTTTSITPQIITIPVPVPDYAYPFSSWPAQHSWASSTSHHRPPMHYAPYPVLPMMPAMRPPLPPYGGMPPLPYNLPNFHPNQQRYPVPRHSQSSYHHRFKKT